MSELFDPFETFEARYRSLAVTTCEWRAFGVVDPETLADLVFARLRARGRLPDLRLFYQAVEWVVSQAYQREADQKPLFESMMRGQFGGHRTPKSETEQVREALIGLRWSEIEILRQVFWDSLTPDELAEVNGKTPQEQQARLQAALTRFALRMPAAIITDPVTAMRELQPGTRRRRPAHSGDG